MRQHLQNELHHVRAVKPSASDLERGWCDAARGVAYKRKESDDWQMGWRLWHHEYGARRSSRSFH
jgi:hypothetical protein